MLGPTITCVVGTTVMSETLASTRSASPARRSTHVLSGMNICVPASTERVIPPFRPAASVHVRLARGGNAARSCRSLGLRFARHRRDMPPSGRASSSPRARRRARRVGIASAQSDASARTSSSELDPQSGTRASLATVRVGYADPRLDALAAAYEFILRLRTEHRESRATQR